MEFLRAKLHDMADTQGLDSGRRRRKRTVEKHGIDIPTLNERKSTL